MRAAAAAIPDERKRLRFGRTAVAHLFTLAALLAWWGYSQFIPDYQLPGPFQVARRMLGFATSAEEMKQLGLSLFHVTAAIAIAFVLGCALAALATPSSRCGLRSRTGSRRSSMRFPGSAGCSSPFCGSG